jgi:hypothetical protein
LFQLFIICFFFIIFQFYIFFTNFQFAIPEMSFINKINQTNEARENVCLVCVCLDERKKKPLPHFKPKLFMSFFQFEFCQTRIVYHLKHTHTSQKSKNTEKENNERECVLNF